MINILIVSSAVDSLAELIHHLEQRPDLGLTRASTAAGALTAVSATRFDLVIADEALDDMSGLTFARRLVGTDPMANLALVSCLSPEAFHEASEGLGVLARLPAPPDAESARALLDQLDRILNMTSRSSRS